MLSSSACKTSASRCRRIICRAASPAIRCNFASGVLPSMFAFSCSISCGGVSNASKLSMILLPLTLFCNHYSESTETLAIPAQFTIFSTVSAVLSSICSIYRSNVCILLVLAKRMNLDESHTRHDKKEEAHDIASSSSLHSASSNASVALGNLTRKTVPSPRIDSTSILPSCARTISLQIDNPSPVPPIFRLSELSTR